MRELLRVGSYSSFLMDNQKRFKCKVTVRQLRTKRKTGLKLLK
jgi:hypothetical protein